MTEDSGCLVLKHIDIPLPSPNIGQSDPLFLPLPVSF